MGKFWSQVPFKEISKFSILSKGLNMNSSKSQGSFLTL